MLALTPHHEAARRLCLAWGIHPVIAADARTGDDMANRACSTALDEGFAQSGERVIVVAGFPFVSPGATNNFRLAYVGRG